MAKRLKELESEIAKHKKLLAEAHLDMHALTCFLGGASKREASASAGGGS